MNTSDDRRNFDLELHEKIARMEVMISHLAELIETHMKREEQERAEILEKIQEIADKHNALSDSHVMFKGEYNKQKMFVAGIVAAVSTVWIIVFGLFELFKFFSGK